MLNLQANMSRMLEVLVFVLRSWIFSTTGGNGGAKRRFCVSEHFPKLLVSRLIIGIIAQQRLLPTYMANYCWIITFDQKRVSCEIWQESYNCNVSATVWIKIQAKCTPPQHGYLYSEDTDQDEFLCILYSKSLGWGVPSFKSRYEAWRSQF